MSEAYLLKDSDGRVVGACRALPDDRIQVHLTKPFLGRQDFTVSDTAELHALADIQALVRMDDAEAEKILKLPGGDAELRPQGQPGGMVTRASVLWSIFLAVLVLFLLAAIF